MSKDTEAKKRISAADVILTAAEQSGLLEEVAKALCFDDRHHSETVWYVPRELLNDLAAAFDNHLVGSPQAVLEGCYGVSDINIGQFSEAELAPYLGERSATLDEPTMTGRNTPR